VVVFPDQPADIQITVHICCRKAVRDGADEIADQSADFPITRIGLTRVAGAVPVDPLHDLTALAKNGAAGNFPLN